MSFGEKEAGATTGFRCDKKLDISSDTVIMNVSSELDNISSLDENQTMALQVFPSFKTLCIPSCVLLP